MYVNLAEQMKRRWNSEESETWDIYVEVARFDEFLAFKLFNYIGLVQNKPCQSPLDTEI